ALALQLLRPKPTQGQHPIGLLPIAISDPQPIHQEHQDIQDPSCSINLEHITFVTSNGPIRDRRTQIWSYEGESQEVQTIMNLKEKVERPLELIRPCGQNQKEPIVDRPLVLIYPEVPILPDSQAIPQSSPCTHETESSPLQLIFPPGGVPR